MSLAERIHLTNPPAGQTYIQLFVEGTGDMDSPALAEAVTAASKTCPGSRLTRRGGVWVDRGGPPAVRVLDGDALDRETFVGLPALWLPLPGERGEPTCEVVLLTGRRPTVVFRVHHAAMDGKGTLLWVGEVFRALRGDLPQPAESEETQSDLLRRYGPGSRPAFSRKRAPPPLRVRAKLADRGSFLLRRTIPGTHVAVVAKVAAALNELCAFGTGFYTVPVDLRRHERSLRSTANLSGVLGVSVVDGDTWRQVHQRLLRALMDNEDLYTLGGRKLMDALGRMPMPALRWVMRTADTLLAKNGVPQSAFVLTHFGRLDVGEYSGGGFAADTVYALPTAGLAVMPMITISEVSGHTEIILCGDSGEGMCERGEHLLDGVQKVLCALPE